MSCGADAVANSLMPTLVAGKTFPLPETNLDDDIYKIPDITGPLFDPPSKITLAELTTKEVNGTGVFDALMTTISKHLEGQFNSNRITGQQFTEAYIGSIQYALQTANQFLLGRDQAYYQALQAQFQAQQAQIGVVTSRVQLATAKAQLAIAATEAATAEAQYALTKIKLASEDANYCLLLVQKSTADYNLDHILPEQYTGIKYDNTTKSYTNTYLLPLQRALLQEQIEVQRAQTLDKRTDGTVITGSVGKQKDLYNQQIISYQRDAEVKAAKLFTDAWITQKTIDEGLLPPAQWKNDSINILLRNIKNNNSLSIDPGVLPGES